MLLRHCHLLYCKTQVIYLQKEYALVYNRNSTDAHIAQLLHPVSFGCHLRQDVLCVKCLTSLTFACNVTCARAVANGAKRIEREKVTFWQLRKCINDGDSVWASGEGEMSVHRWQENNCITIDRKRPFSLTVVKTDNSRLIEFIKMVARKQFGTWVVFSSLTVVTDLVTMHKEM